MIFNPSTAGEVRHLNHVRHQASAGAFVSEIDRKIAQLSEEQHSQSRKQADGAARTGFFCTIQMTRREAGKSFMRFINDFAPSTMGWVRHLIYAQREASTGAFKAKLAAELPF